MTEEYQLLDKRVQKWLFNQGWPDLREIQKRAIIPILACDRDVLISASTAAGKTEAFFLPACSAIAEEKDGFGILYISPLKALINDQYRRLESLSEMLDLQVTPWHGDSLQSKKKKARNNPSGILLITPESLESLLVREPGWVKQSFTSLKYIVIDEFHAFIGTERGQQLLSLLTRLEHLIGRITNPIPRVALSATLGELEKVPLSLRPNKSLPCETITSSQHQSTIKVQVKGYLEPVDIMTDDTCTSSEQQICKEIFRLCRGDSHLVFANSRSRTESIAAQLSDLCEQQVVPNEFFPHHGSLAKELREDLEARLQKEAFPTTAICTMTLELGIDIGKVSSVIQVTAPHSVSSLRQRLGRSGRRNTPSILRMFISENELSDKSNIVDNLRLELVQSLAMIRLLIIDNWFEPADTKQMHFSTFLHQILAVIAQWGSARVDQLYSLLCEQGSFKEISIQHFKQLLTHMGTVQLIQQLNSGELVLGIEGERLTNSYTFYAVFKTPEEFRIVTGSKTLGTLPLDSLILKDQHIIFGGRRWKVTDIDDEKKVIYVTSTKGGKPPKFNGNGMSIHDRVRQEMLRIYCSGDYRIEVGNQKIDFVDKIGSQLFQEGAYFFKEANLENQPIYQSGKHCYIFSWMGDKVVNTLTILLIKSGHVCSNFAGVIEVQNASVDALKDYFMDIIIDGVPDETELAEILSLQQKMIEKYDEYLPEGLLNAGYGRKAFDSKATKEWISGLLT
ncbi:MULTISPECIES: DEAD/DEAH box helicase [Marinomonas]|uniref:DEAD/DEAH box helicase n=1 Tax=Marinomonas arctica TaxID=383750 RepID=A0A7H1J4I9_9GAMM|nr:MULTISPECIES: DEAD/DEAH box helicase [Marinomonas]MCS7488333.1 DEAD/DEAH box helicase [Marinomonas sp. BSi20414]QNT05405.1 DEAD/DEAH box helicase [Marinomonas arctica]GGN38071.1 ATP-dependent helicase [Marinomonas arctica]